MANKKVLTRKEAKELVEDLVTAAKVVCALVEVEAPGSKQVVLDTLISELEEMADRKKLCIGAGVCRNEPAENCDQSPVLDFGQAFHLLKDGCRLARKEWGAGEAVILITNPMHGKGEPQDPDDVRLLTSVLARETASSFLTGWHPSRRDLLAEDWYVVK